jgi:hypothetical protein
MSYVKSVVQFIAASMIQIKFRSEYEYECDLDALVKQWMPRGSGIDCGTQLDIVKSTGTKLVFTFDYHHMDQHGYYCGWSNHKLIVTPAFEDFTMKIIGQHPSKERHQTTYFHDYLYDTFNYALQSRYEYKVDLERKVRIYTSVDRPNMQITMPAHWLKKETNNA